MADMCANDCEPFPGGPVIENRYRRLFPAAVATATIFSFQQNLSPFLAGYVSHSVSTINHRSFTPRGACVRQLRPLA